MNPFAILALIFLVPTIVVLFARLGLAKLGWQRGRIFHWILGIVQGLAVLLAIVSSTLVLKFDIYPPGYRTWSWIVVGAGAVIFLVSILWRSDSNFLGTFWICLGGFAAGVAMILAWEVLDDGPRQLVYDDSRFRIEETQRMFGPCDFKLFVKLGYYEQAYDFGEMRCYDFTRENVAQIEVFETEYGYRVEWTLRNWDTDLGGENPFVVDIQR